MRVPFYNIRAQYQELQAELDAAVHGVLSSGAYIMGTHHDALEKQIAEMHGVKHGIAVHSGTDALRIAMDALGIGPGDEVITPTFTFVSSVETIVQTGATPIFVDIDPGTFNIAASKIEAAITPRTKAILPVHLFGQLAEVDTIAAIAASHGLIVLEDAAQALDCRFRGTSTGNFGMAAAFSFYVTKNLGAAGDAGMIITNDDEVAEKCRSIRVHGMGRQRYYYDHIGYTSRLDEIQAAILGVKLARFRAWNDRRCELAAIYQSVLSDSGVKLPFIREGNNCTWHQFTVRSDRRDALQAFLRTKEVDSMIYYPVPLHFHAPYQAYGLGEGSLPETERACKEVLSLPIHPHLSDDQVRFVANCVREFAASPASLTR